MRMAANLGRVGIGPGSRRASARLQLIASGNEISEEVQARGIVVGPTDVTTTGKLRTVDTCITGTGQSVAVKMIDTIVSGLPCGEGPSGLKMVVRSPADVVLPWSFEAVQ